MVPLGILTVPFEHYEKAMDVDAVHVDHSQHED